MNTKIALSIGATLIVLGIGYYSLRPATPALPPADSVEVSSTTTSPTATVPATATSTPPKATKDPSKPTFTIGPTTMTATNLSASFDAASLTSSATYPVITGTATVPKIGMIIYNSENVGIIGVSDILVTQGHWSYACSIPLEPGTYTVKIFFGTAYKTATLTVTSPS